MKKAKAMLTKEQMAVTLNNPGTLWSDDGSPAEDHTIGSELAKYTRLHRLEIEAVEADFDTIIVEDEDGKEQPRLAVRHFTAWSRDHVLVVMPSMFADMFMAVIRRNPSNSPVTVSGK